jgi:hypothetical protein
MSVWSEPAANPPLAGREGVLVSVTIDVAARDLEALLDALANIDFPVNPQIYHDAAVRQLYADGRQSERPVTLVEFPAYAGRVEEVGRAVEARGFDRGSIHVSEMLDAIHSESLLENSPPGTAYRSRCFLKRRDAVQ